jgi:hypothetical protein
MNNLSVLSITCEVLSLLCLLTLHFVSREFKPGWRFISEYALGKHKWLITWFFLLWGIGSIFLSLLLFCTVTGTWPVIGVLALFVSGIGEIMGGLFDAKHKYHGLAFALGVPALPIAALILGYHLANTEGWKDHSSVILLSSHATWISLLLMFLSMMIMFSGFKKAGIVMNKDSQPPEQVPPGVIAVSGYFNRLLVLAYVLWVILIAWIHPSI